MKDTFGVQQPKEVAKTEPDEQPTSSCTVLSLAWKWDARLKHIIGMRFETTTEEAISKSSPENKTNNTRKDPWQLTVFLFWISGTLGWWGTLTLWNDGTTTEGQAFILGNVNPLIGFLALTATIFSLFLFNYLMKNADGFDE